MDAADPQDAGARRTGLAWWGAVGVIAAAGIYYRVREIGSLHLILDERLVLRRIQGQSLLDAFVQHTMANNSPAITIYAQALYRWGLLDELTLRLPMVASGILLLAVPLLFVGRLGRPTTLIYLALVASSAPLVYFSFVARPYAPTLLAIGIGFFAWDQACRSHTRRSAALFGSAASLAVFLHAFAAPVVASGFALGLYEALRGRLPWKTFGVAVAWAVGVAALLLGPGAASFVSTHATKAGVGRLSAGLPWEILERLVGARGAASSLVLLAIGIGLVQVHRRDRRLALAGTLAIAFPLLALLIVRPLGGAADWARYMLLCWPIALLFAACGLAWAVTTLARALGDRRGLTTLALWTVVAIAFARLAPADAAATGWLRWAVAPFFSWGAALLVIAALVERQWGRGWGVASAGLLLLVGSFALSPVRLYRQAPDSFRSHPQVLQPLVPGEAPAFYTRLATQPDAGDAILECPDPGELIHSAPYARYQQVHGKRVLLLSPLADDYRAHFRNLVDPSQLATLRRSGARYALIHRNLWAEFGNDDSAPQRRFDVPAARCRALLRSALGAPVYSDDLLEVFDLRAPGDTD